MSADSDFEPMRNIEPFKSPLTHLDSIAAGNNLSDKGKQKSGAGAYDEAMQMYHDALARYQEVLGDRQSDVYVGPERFR
jgi:hypothetical protein